MAKINTKNKVNILEAPIASTMFELTAPAVIGVVSLMLFGLVDAFFVSLLGTDALTAAGLAFPILVIMLSLSFGLSASATSLVSRTMGGKQFNLVQLHSTSIIILTIIISLLFSICGILTMEPLFKLMGAQQTVLTYAMTYMSIIYAGSVFVLLPIVCQAIYRSIGDPRTPAIVMVGAAVLNVILCPLFIFGLGPFPVLGIAGAAYASVFSWIISAIYILWLLYYRENVINLAEVSLVKMLNSWRKSLFIAIPSIVSNMMQPIIIGVMFTIGAKFGDEVIAAVGIGARVETVASVIGIALTTSMPAFVGQNWGAKQFDRIFQAFKKTHKFNMISHLIIYIILILLAPIIAIIFTKDTMIAHFTKLFLYTVPIGYGAYASATMIGSSTNAINHPWYGIGYNFLRLFIITLPLMWLGSYYFDIIGLFLGYGLGNLFGGLLVYHISYDAYKKAARAYSD